MNSGDPRGEDVSILRQTIGAGIAVVLLLAVVMCVRYRDEIFLILNHGHGSRSSSWSTPLSEAECKEIAQTFRLRDTVSDTLRALQLEDRISIERCLDAVRVQIVYDGVTGCVRVDLRLEHWKLWSLGESERSFDHELMKRTVEYVRSEADRRHPPGSN